MKEELEDDGTPFVTTAQIVKATGTTPATVTRWVAAEKLQPVHKGQGLRGAFLFDRDDVKAFLDQRAHASK